MAPSQPRPRVGPLLTFLLLAVGPAGCGVGAKEQATDTWAGVDVFFYDPDKTPDIDELEDGSQDGGGPGGQDGGDDGGDFDARFEGTIEIRVAGAVEDTCTGTAVVERVGPQDVEGSVACRFTGDLASSEPTEGLLSGDAGGDGTMTVRLTADPFVTTLSGTFGDQEVRLAGSDTIGGDIEGSFAVTIEGTRTD